MNKKTLIGFVAFISLLTFFLIKNQPLFVDELVHHQVAKNFCNLKPILHPNLTNIPGYHAVIAAICFVTKPIYYFADSLTSFRIFSLLLSLSGLYYFYKLTQLVAKNDQQQSTVKTLQYFLLPLAFPFYFLVYTDIPALALVVAAFYFALKKNYTLSGFLVAISVAFRQNNIIWLGFIGLYIFLFHFKFKLDPKSILKFLASTWSFILATLAFIGFIYLNGGISLGKAEEWAHPSFSLHFGNVYLMLFYFFIIFLPLNLANFSNLVKFIKKRPLVTLAILISFFALYWKTFSNTHPYNQHTFAVHNWLLVFFTKNSLNKLIFFAPTAYSLFSFLVTKLIKPKYYLFVPFSLLFLLPSWLIEPRYYILPFIFFILFRKRLGIKTELFSAGLSFIISVIFVIGIVTKNFFP